MLRPRRQSAVSNEANCTALLSENCVYSPHAWPASVYAAAEGKKRRKNVPRLSDFGQN